MISTPLNRQVSEAEARLREGLKTKGIGPTGSKRFSAEQLAPLLPLLKDQQINRSTAAAFWMACLVLESSPEEAPLLRPLLEQPEAHLLPELQALLKPNSLLGRQGEFLQFIQQIIRHEDLSFAQAQQAMTYFWDEAIPDWLKGAFLQGERLKRETLPENLAFLDSLWKQVDRIQVDLPCVIDLCDSYDGTSRSYHLTPFVASLLGAMGVPCVVHGVESLGPKYGITTAQLLKQAGKAIQLSRAQARSQITDSEVGWCYLDQSVAAPKIFALRQLRQDILKRPFLATFDKLLQPIWNQGGNIVIVGYVHSGYKEEIVKLLSLHHQNRAVFNLRTIEGSTNCWGKKPTPFVGYRCPPALNVGTMIRPDQAPAHDLPLAEFLRAQNKQGLQGELIPSQFGIQRDDHEIIKEVTLEETIEAGLAALKGKPGLAYDLLIYHAAAFAWLGGVIPHEQEAAALAAAALKSGRAWAHWQAHA